MPWPFFFNHYISTIWSPTFFFGNPQHVAPFIENHNIVFPKHGCHSQRLLKFLIQKQFPLSVFVFIDSLVVTRVAMRFPAKITSSCIWVAIPVDWVILHQYGCGADGQSLAWCTVTLLPNFLGWVDVLTHGAPLVPLIVFIVHCMVSAFTVGIIRTQLFNVQSNKLTNLLYMEFCDGCVELCILE